MPILNMNVQEYLKTEKEMAILRAELKKEVTAELTPILTDKLEKELRPLIILDIESKYYLVPIKTGHINKDYVVDFTISEVCKAFNVSRESISNNGRKEHVVKARHIISYVCRTIMSNSISYGFIGQKLGGKNHATILHGCRVCRDLMDTDKVFKLSVDSILSIVNDEVNKS